MNQVPPYPLWVGHADDGRDFRLLFDSGIGAIVQLAIEEPPIPTPRELIYLRFPLLDGAGNDPALLRLAVDAVTRLLQCDFPVLVCCGAGMSRSPLIAAAAIAQARAVPLETALSLVGQYRPLDLSPPLVNDIRSMLSPLR